MTQHNVSGIAEKELETQRRAYELGRDWELSDGVLTSSQLRRIIGPAKVSPQDFNRYWLQVERGMKGVKFEVINDETGTRDHGQAATPERVEKAPSATSGPNHVALADQFHGHVKDMNRHPGNPTVTVTIRAAANTLAALHPSAEIRYAAASLVEHIDQEPDGLRPGSPAALRLAILWVNLNGLTGRKRDRRP